LCNLFCIFIYFVSHGGSPFFKIKNIDPMHVKNRWNTLILGILGTLGILGICWRT
jgi:hypothetical protein